MTSSRSCNTTSRKSRQQSAISSQPANVRRGLWLIAVLLTIPTLSYGDDRAKAAELVARAAAASRLSNLKGAYTLKLSFRVPGEHGTEGTYQYWSVTPFHWRSEIKARGYHEVEVGEPDRRWVEEDLPYAPEPIHRLAP